MNILWQLMQTSELVYYQISIENDVSVPVYANVQIGLYQFFFENANGP